MYYHKPVMPAEVLKYLAVAADKVYIDCTTGEGGHSEYILKRFNVKRLICIEQDKEVLNIAKERLKEYKNVIFINDSYVNLKKILKELNIKKVNGILFDLGLSMYHYKASNKGFTFEKDQALDMQLNPESNITGYDIINNYSYKDLVKIIWAYGEEKFSRRIAKFIIEWRKREPIETTLQLKEIIEKAVPKKFWKQNLHPATRTFQALRIAVNDELYNIEKAVTDSIKILVRKGRLVVISYHSLEDRIVKYIFRLYSKGITETGEKEESKKDTIKVLTKKPIIPTVEEIKKNRSARSAKLRAIERL